MNILKFDLKKFRQKELDDLMSNGRSIVLRQGEVPYLTPEDISPYAEIIYPRSEIIYPPSNPYDEYFRNGTASTTFIVSTSDFEGHELSVGRLKRAMVDGHWFKD